ncbi:MAG: FAD-dependent oxidoreductase [Ectothiorhodospiraceae bacterium]|nr:FAD-dependent oxidoreductase [Ectothiorhodospiraceae bacterium]MCH8504590.1 FAD-dependent oxidoreductase [Ectothiorhodospiraceae bacterium]
MSKPVVIVGTGLAGYTTAREFRKHDAGTPLVLLTADDGRSYSKPMLSTACRKGKSADELAQATAEAMAGQLDATVRAGVTVDALDPAAHRLRADGEVLEYGKLVLALGAEPRRPPVAGDAVDAIHQVNDLQQYAAFRAAAANARELLIIGGGLVGCEFANDLADAGIRVTQVYPEAYPLERLVPAQAGAALAIGLKEIGVVQYPGCTVERVDHHQGAFRVSLGDGTRLQADLVLSAVGLEPRTALARQAGLQVERGIVVDRYLQTSAPDIHALGDCAEVEGHLLQYVAPLTAAARALGATLAGQRTAVEYPAMPITVKTSCCQVVCWPPASTAQGDWRFDGEGLAWRGEYRDAQNELQGFVLTSRRMRERMELTEQLPPLIADH